MKNLEELCAIVIGCDFVNTTKQKKIKNKKLIYMFFFHQTKNQYKKPRVEMLSQQISNMRIYHRSANPDINVLLHDIFNVSALSIISILNTIYLLLVVSDIYDYLRIPLFPIILYSFMGYIVLDTLIIYYFPECVVSKPRDLLIHHGITFIICLSPIIEKEFEWHAGLALTVEIQTVFLTLNRLIIDKTKLANKIISTIFYILFIAFRVIIFPMLTIYYYITYQTYSVKCNTQINIAITAVIGFSIITLMGFIWIYKFIAKKQIYKKIKNYVPFCSIETSKKTKLVKLSFTT